MARIITGITWDLGDGSPTIDVDTAVLQLLDELEGRPRVRNALAALINFASNEQQPWVIYDNNDGVKSAGRLPREVEMMNRATRVIVLKAIPADTADEDGNIPSLDEDTEGHVGPDPALEER